MSDSLHQEDSQQVAGSTGSESRRRFVRGVGLATPVMLAISSRSALATGGSCLSPSASASIALLKSRPDREKSTCSGRSPGYWGSASQEGHTHHGVWLSTGANDKLFSDVFGDGNAYPGKTLKDVLAMNGSQDPYQLGAHLVAAWCNLQKMWVPASVLSLQQLLDMWQNRKAYMPVPGMKDPWNEEIIVGYIKKTFFDI